MRQNSECVEYDSKTKKWFSRHIVAQTTICKCSKCGLWYKPILGHECKRESKDNIANNSDKGENK